MNYTCFGENVGERLENMIKNFETHNILIEGFYKVIPIDNRKRVDYKPSLI
jgi:hypothetical protein